MNNSASVWCIEFKVYLANLNKNLFRKNFLFIGLLGAFSRSLYFSVGDILWFLIYPQLKSIKFFQYVNNPLKKIPIPTFFKKVGDCAKHQGKASDYSSEKI